MNISKLQLKNFKNFSFLQTDFEPGVNLFVGINGCGKTSLLEGICVAVGAFFGSQGRHLQRIIEYNEIKITKGKREPLAQVAAWNEFSKDKLFYNQVSEKINWNIVRNRDDNTLHNNKLKNASDYGKIFFDAFDKTNDKTIAPLIVYFSTQRLFKETKNISGYSDIVTSGTTGYSGSSGQTSSQKYDVTMGRRNGYLQCLEENTIKSTLIEWFGNAVTRRATMQIKEIERVDFVLENVETAVRNTLIDFLDLPDNFSLKIYQDPDFNYELFLQYDIVHDLPLSYYSDGFKNLLFLVIDMVWRASQLNPWLTLQEISEKVNGVAIIDEIDLHLHPKWQCKAIPLLQKLFPKVQFFITTHSPTVIANFSSGTLYTIDNNMVSRISDKYFGKEVNYILRNTLSASDRHIETQVKLDQLFRFIDDNEPNKVISPLLDELIDILGNNDPDIQKALSLIEWNNYKKENPDAIH